MPMHHHHHENKRDKSATRNIEAIRREKVATIDINEHPLPEIKEPISNDEVSVIIKSVTGDFEDAFQDAWVRIVEEHAVTEEQFLRIAREVNSEHARKAVGEKYSQVSLDTPIGKNKDEGDFTLEDVLASPPLEIDEPEPNHTRGKKYGNISVNNDVVELLREKFPGQPMTLALRLALHLPTGATTYWKTSELKLLTRDYAYRTNESLSIELGRSIPSVQKQAVKLHLKKEGRLRVPQGSYTARSVCRIFSFSDSHLKHIMKKGYLPWRVHKGMRLFHHKDIAHFIKTQSFEFRHEMLAQQWRQYVLPGTLEWLPVLEAAREVHMSAAGIKEYIYLDELPFKEYCPHTHFAWYVKLDDVRAILNLPKLGKIPYKVAYFGSKKHYVEINKDGDMVSACSPNGGKSWSAYLLSIHQPTYFEGSPNCLRCLAIRKKLRKQQFRVALANSQAK